jgi:hypothetical protein
LIGERIETEKLKGDSKEFKREIILATAKDRFALTG